MQRLLLVSPNWIGDAMFATAVVRVLRQRQPTMTVSVLCHPRVAEVFRGNPRVQRVICDDERDTGLRPWWRLQQALHRERFEAALLLRPSLSRTWLLWWAGMPMRIGPATRKSGWLLTHPVAVPKGLHRADGYLRLLSALGWTVTPGEGRCEWCVGEADRAWAQAWLAHAGVTHRPLVMLHPAANWEHKRWPAECFATLADRLHTDCGARVLITGSPQETPLLEQMRQHLQTDPVSAVGHTTISQLAALFECADLIVTNDTGPMHLAVALDRPFVALFGPTSPTITGPYGAHRGRVLHNAGACPVIPCYNAEHPPHRGMHSLSVEDVFGAAKALLQETAMSLERSHG